MYDDPAAYVEPPIFHPAKLYPGREIAAASVTVVPAATVCAAGVDVPPFASYESVTFDTVASYNASIVTEYISLVESLKTTAYSASYAASNVMTAPDVVPPVERTVPAAFAVEYFVIFHPRNRHPLSVDTCFTPIA